MRAHADGVADRPVIGFAVRFDGFEILAIPLLILAGFAAGLLSRR